MQQERFGKYELRESLGHGGMGEVWKAFDTQLHRYVAIKVLHADRQNPDFVAQFMHEARLVASLRHPNIVQVHDFQFTDTPGRGAKAYMVMDYVEGGTLADYISTTIRQGNFPTAPLLVALFTSISLALDYAHEKAMVHRDIKPANILLDKAAGSPIGEPVLTDFGIAKLQDAGTSVLTHSFIGTPLYISPEQAEGHAVDDRSDLYSLGIVLYEVLTGTTPFQGASPLAVMMHHVHDEPTSPSQLNPRITPALSAVVLKSIAKKPQERFSSARAMTAALAHALEVPLPASLLEPGEGYQSSTYNPLQPGTVTFPATVSGYTPPVRTVPSFPSAQNGSTGTVMVDAAAQARPLPPLSSAKAAKPPRARRKWLVPGSVAGIVLLCILLGVVFVRPLLSSSTSSVTPTPVNSNAVLGHIAFAHSVNAPANTFDQLQVDLTTMASPAPGTTYYAWLETLQDDASIQYWQVAVPTNGNLHAIYESNPRYTDLFTASNIFLITEETGTPFIPNPDLTKRIYYAPISHTSSSPGTFDIKHCPSGSQAASSKLCL